MSTSDDRWSHLVSLAFLVDQACERGGGEGTGAALQLFDSALEVFPAGIDPVEDFEGYAVRRLLLSLRAAFTPREG